MLPTMLGHLLNRQLLEQMKQILLWPVDARTIHKCCRDSKRVKLITTYIRAMFQQDLDNLIPVVGAGQVQRRPTTTVYIDINTLGQQHPHSRAVPLTQKCKILAQTPVQTHKKGSYSCSAEHRQTVDK